MPRESVRNKIVDNTRLSWEDKDTADEVRHKFTPLARRIRSLVAAAMNFRATVRWRSVKHSSYILPAIHSCTGWKMQHNELSMPSILPTMPLVLQRRASTLLKDAAGPWPQ